MRFLLLKLNQNDYGFFKRFVAVLKSQKEMVAFTSNCNTVVVWSFDCN